MMFDTNRSMLAGTTVAMRRQWLTDAQSAYALLMSGGKPVSVSYEGKAVSYTPTDAGALLSWIGLLQASLGLGRSRRALRPYFR
ncbi:gpW family protein [Methylobacterium sp. J-030]|uniref:gpW family protein n=1 Tax=Methylobacterium sp. J-030 TaxID=2836627 RepID=UPI001FB918E6|nr:gpW family protein [Methylobacterium sp. J-030]MCJ2067764.1 gpW family protein [Methylobacterium sp. J-030]